MPFDTAGLKGFPLLGCGVILACVWFMIVTAHVFTIPAGAIPEWLGELEGLEELELQNNSLAGELRTVWLLNVCERYLSPRKASRSESCFICQMYKADRVVELIGARFSKN